MKPMSPEERELDSTSAEISARYRAGASDEPPARLDAAIQAAARREVERLQPRPNWQVPVSLAAMLVIGASLVLLVRESEPPLPSLEGPAALQSRPAEALPAEAKLARPDAPPLTMKQTPGGRTEDVLQTQPSRERSSRDRRTAGVREEWAAAPIATVEGSAKPAAAASAAPVSPPAAGRIDSIEAEQSPLADAAEAAARKEVSGVDEVRPPANSGAQALRSEKKLLEQRALLKKEASAPLPQQEWLANIDELLRRGKEAEARLELRDFRQHYPRHRLPEHLQTLLSRDQR